MPLSTFKDGSPMDGSSPRAAVRQFVVESFLFGQGGDLTDEASFLEQGIVDSTGILELVAFLEETYGITVGDSELTPDNLDSIDAIVAFLSRRLAPV